MIQIKTTIQIQIKTTIKKLKDKFVVSLYQNKEIMEDINSLFVESLLEKRVVLPIKYLDENMEKNVVNQIRRQFTGKCIEEGFIHPESVSLKSYSAGKIGPHGIHLMVLFSCQICYPPAGLIVSCTVTDLTKAGVHAVCQIATEAGIFKPVSVYILRDHEFKSDMFDRVKKGEMIKARILGSRFELGDSCINAVAEFV